MGSDETLKVYNVGDAKQTHLLGGSTPRIRWARVSSVLIRFTPRAVGTMGCQRLGADVEKQKSVNSQNASAARERGSIFAKSIGKIGCARVGLISRFANLSGCSCG